MRVTLILCWFLAFQTSAFAQWTSDEWSVVFSEQTLESEARGLVESFGLTPLESYYPAYNVMIVQDPGGMIKEIEFAAGVRTVEFSARLSDGSPVAVLPELLLKSKPGISEAQIRAFFAKHAYLNFRQNSFLPEIYSVEKTSQDNGLIELIEGSGLFGLVIPKLIFPVEDCSVNDPLYNRQWALKNEGTPLQGNGTPGADISVEQAWEITSGSPEVIIAILDSGVDTLHPDLSSKLLPGFDAIGTGTNGQPSGALSSDGHGTCCAGIAAAETDNDEGIAGVCRECRIVPVRVFTYISSAGENIPVSDAETFIDGITWQWQVANADVSSNSWGLTDEFLAMFPGQDLLVNTAIEAAVNNGRNGLGLPMIFSSGNTGDTDDEPIWPARLEYTFAVNATSMCDEQKSFTSCDNESWEGNSGPGLDVSAPGVRISATDMTGSAGYHNSNYYHFFNGTSSACPIVAGIAGLAYSYNPALLRTELESAIRMGCEKVGGYDYDLETDDGTWSTELGHGRVNAFQTLQVLGAASVSESRPIGVIHETHTDFHVFRVSGAPASWMVYDVTGKPVLGKTMSDTFEVDELSLSSGMYLLQVQNANGTETMRFFCD